MKDPVHVFEDLPNNYAQTNIAFSPDEQLILTGTSVERDSTVGGLLCFYDRSKLELVSRVGISPTYSVVQCAWHPKLNQVRHFDNLRLPEHQSNFWFRFRCFNLLLLVSCGTTALI